MNTVQGNKTSWDTLGFLQRDALALVDEDGLLRMDTLARRRGILLREAERVVQGCVDRNLAVAHRILPIDPAPWVWLLDAGAKSPPRGFACGPSNKTHHVRAASGRPWGGWSIRSPQGRCGNRFARWQRRLSRLAAGLLTTASGGGSRQPRYSEPTHSGCPKGTWFHTTVRGRIGACLTQW
jgi:hypothetical protein